MEGAWFRKWKGFGYVPICWQGWAVLSGMVLVFVPFGFLFVRLVYSNPVLSWTCGAIAAAAALTGHAVIVWKLERDYGS